MAKPTTTTTDNLAHIDAAGTTPDANDPTALFNQVSATNGSITIISAFGCSVVLSWSFTATGVTIVVTLRTPFGNVTLIDATLDAANPSITFGGSIAGFKAEGTVSFDVAALSLTASGEVCAPFVGCKSGSVTVHV